MVSSWLEAYLIRVVMVALDCVKCYMARSSYLGDSGSDRNRTGDSSLSDPRRLATDATEFTVYVRVSTLSSTLHYRKSLVHISLCGPGRHT